MSEETAQQKKRSVHRSPAYPSISLEKAIPLAEKLNEKFSDDPFSRDNAVVELGLKKGGTAFRKIAALVQYGLISRKGSSYSITPLTKQIIFPGDDETIKQSAIKNAAKSPKLYKGLILSYQGKQLPTALHHRLITSEGFNQSFAEEVAKDFKKTMEFAGILKNGIMDNLEDVNVSQSPEMEEEIPFEGKSDKPRIGETKMKQHLGDGVPFPLGPDVIVTLSEKLVRDITMGKFGDRFAKALETLEKLGKEEVNESSSSNASDSPMESD